MCFRDYKEDVIVSEGYGCYDHAIAADARLSRALGMARGSAIVRAAVKNLR